MAEDRETAPPSPSPRLSTVSSLWNRLPVSKALRHRDFRLLWVGALFSFIGSQVQNVAQGYYVYQITGHDAAKLAMVMFFFNIPVMFLAPFSGLVADLMNRKTAMILSLVVSTIAAVILALGTHFQWLTYEHILAIALINGTVQTIEAPARQSVVRIVVGEEDLPFAIPAQAMTFNLARIIGPPIGMTIAAFWGVQACFLINAISFFALIGAVIMIRSDLRPIKGETSRISDLLLDGIRHTFRDLGLRTLFLMEAATSILGMFYLSLMPAIVNTKLGPGKIELGYAQGSVGIGALCGLLLLGALSAKAIRPLITRIAMMNVAIGLTVLSFLHYTWMIYPVLALIGMSQIMQFNTTNTLFQMMAPNHLRGRVIAMHLWAISGLAPIGIYVFGQLAEHSSPDKTKSLDLALITGGVLLLVATIWAWVARQNVTDPARLRETGAA